MVKVHQLISPRSSGLKTPGISKIVFESRCQVFFRGFRYAIAAFEEDFKGTLTPGKYADIVVLSQDLLTVEEDRIPDTQVEITIVGGEVKYTRGM